ncbi:ComEA family DNA-binding protein [Ferruginibacter sp. SUN106]|uniref:ComEA family DNA-binding protein n=1 Tax=Ferruginibacter sp. SUN106 TaxID=2978348 RepID=UPI003D36419E
MLLLAAAYNYRVKAFKAKQVLLSFAICLYTTFSLAQTPELPATATEQQLENNTENNADAETEDDTYLQQMQEYSRHPINLNTADENEIRELKILSPLQIQSLISYRNIFGKLIDIYELQAIPGWDIPMILKIRPYIIVSAEAELVTTILKRFKSGENSMLVRASQVLEKAKGYRVDRSATTNFYPGSPQKLLVRYKYQFKNLLQYGVTGEKDAGEQFFKGAQKQGFDFYSAHFFVRKTGIIKALALGDFTVNLGQGLTQWQSLAFKKSAAVMNIKREAEVLRPYNSAGEINFHRGAGITLAKAKWEATAFVSYKKTDANLVTDTTQNQDDFISSLQTSGYHRTKSETEDKGIQQQLVFGGNLAYRYHSFHLGLNLVQYKFKLPVIKSNEPYNLYALAGRSFGNYSADYSYTFRNVHLFGEAACFSNAQKAVVTGVLVSVATDVDMSFLYRNISKGYQSLYTTAFTENTYPNNEKGFYAGVSVHPGSSWRIDAYADLYRFPWLKYGVDAPSVGTEYLVQLTYKPNKQLELSSRLRSESKAANDDPGQLTLSPVVPQPRLNWRTQFSYKINTAITVSNRSEMLWINRKTAVAEHGFLTYINFLYKPLVMPWAANMRLQYFETDSYSSRVYAYENDVLYSFSIPVFYDKGFRYYINSSYDFNKKLTFWIKWSQTIYPGKMLIGSGLDEISRGKKSEIKLQFLYKF